MTYESTAEPIKIGYLMDFLLPEGFPKTYFEDLTQPFDLVFQKGVEQIPTSSIASAWSNDRPTPSTSR